MKTRFRVASDAWTTEGRKLTTAENLETIRQMLEAAPIIVEHWFYRGSSSPDRFVFDDYENFIEYLSSKAWAGDSIYSWNFSEVCQDENTIAQGKCPAEDGCVPKRGAY